MNGKELNKNLTLFLNHLDSIKDTLPMVMLLINPHRTKAIKEFQDFFENNVEEIENESGEKSVGFKYEEYNVFQRLKKNSEISVLSDKIIPESLFVSLISQYDAFLNRLLKILFEIRPEYINNSERELTYSQLVNFADIESARDYVVEKEIETVLRKSHTEHFEYIEKKLSMTLRTDLPIWKEFIEITERRNLFVHCDGVVSSQYLKVCGENQCLDPEISLNQRLSIPIEYFNKTYNVLFELATKLTHTIWRKLLKDDMKEADRRLNDVCIELINSRQLILADEILKFACGQKRHFNDLFKNVFVVNRALSKYLNGDKDKAMKIVNEKDWSASSDDFKLAHLTISELYEEAYKLMLKIGKKGEVSREDYKTWPLFARLRKEDKFKETYKKIFDEEYTIMDIPNRPIQNLIGELILKNPELQDKTKDKVTLEKTTKPEEEE